MLFRSALVLPSLYESFGLPIIEAMGSGCPVVTSNRFGTKELAEGAAVLVDPENVDSIAEGMEEIATDKKLQIELIKKGYKRAIEFSWEKCAEKTIKVLEQTDNLPIRKHSGIKIFKAGTKHISERLIIKHQ